MSKQSFDELVRKLDDTRGKIQIVLASLDAAEKPTATDPTLPDGIAGIDAVTYHLMAKAGRTSLNIQLKRIQAALERHKAGTYGRCCRCELAIEMERLTTDPASPSCVDCTDELAEAKRRDQRADRVAEHR